MPRTPSPSSTPPLPKDRLVVEIILTREDWLRLTKLSVRRQMMPAEWICYILRRETRREALTAEDFRDLYREALAAEKGARR